MGKVDDIKKAVDYTTHGKFFKAEKIYKSILKNEPDNAHVLSLLGLLYLNMGSLKKADKYLKKSYSIKPHIVSIEGLGLVNYHLNNDKDARMYFEKIISKTKNFLVFEKYIQILIDNSEYKDAHKIAEKCHELFPLRPEAIDLYIDSLMHIGEFKKADKLCTNLVTRYPKYSNGWQKMGLIFEIYFHDEQKAKKCYEKAVKCGDLKGGYYNLLINASKIFDIEAAKRYIKKLENLGFSDESFNFSKAVVYFKNKEFKKGYKYYVNRTVAENDLQNRYNFKTEWDGKVYKDETLLVLSDQGIGDCIMFSRFLPLLSKYFKQIKVITRESILDLLKRSYAQWKNIKFYPDELKRTPSHDKYAILSGLPFYLGIDISEIPFSDGYLKFDKNIADIYNAKMKTDKYKIGICWEAGSAGWRELLNRTLNITLYEPFFDIKNVQYYSLQVNPTMDNYKTYKNIIDLGSDFKNFDDTAGALANLDLLVTVDTSVVHLAGALGVKTFMLLPYCPDWRWFDNDSRTEWYDSIKIFRQKNTKNWDSVIKNIKDEIVNFVSDK